MATTFESTLICNDTGNVLFTAVKSLFKKHPADEAKVNSLDYNERKKYFEISRADAIIDPGTMMVICVYTMVAQVAMPTPRISQNLAIKA